MSEISPVNTPSRHPPKAPLVFRVGVVGHRPNRLQHADLDLLGLKIHQLLNSIQQTVHDHYRANSALYVTTEPVVRVLSPLAEGVDRIFAEQGLALQCELTAVLPFPQAEYERDFAADPLSESQFRNLLSQALTVFQLDGCRDDESRAYHVAGTVVLNQSDLLIVVWDGERQNKRGGTEETFDDALARGVPIL